MSVRGLFYHKTQREILLVLYIASWIGKYNNVIKNFRSNYFKITTQKYSFMKATTRILIAVPEVYLPTPFDIYLNLYNSIDTVFEVMTSPVYSHIKII